MISKRDVPYAKPLANPAGMASISEKDKPENRASMELPITGGYQPMQDPDRRR